jgi:uncharacterized membrane protein YdjX (TVP38/TMEM64 family)
MLVNYGLGLTEIGFWRYLIASEVAMIPMNAIWVGSAEFAYRTVLRGDIPWRLFGIITAASILLAIVGFFGKRLTKALRTNRVSEGAP